MSSRESSTNPTAVDVTSSSAPKSRDEVTKPLAAAAALEGLPSSFKFVLLNEVLLSPPRPLIPLRKPCWSFEVIDHLGDETAAKTAPLSFLLALNFRNSSTVS